MKLFAKRFLMPIFAIAAFTISMAPATGIAYDSDEGSEAFDKWLARASCGEIHQEIRFSTDSLQARARDSREWKMIVRLKLRDAHHKYSTDCLATTDVNGFECEKLDYQLRFWQHTLREGPDSSEAERSLYRLLIRRHGAMIARLAKACAPVEKAPADGPDRS